MDERLIRLFEEELRHLRETAAEFGAAFPNRAKHLDPKSKPFEGMVEDPYVERLLEGVAFLAARVRLKLDAQFPQFTQGLLETLHPDFLAPVPSMGIFQIEPAAGSPPPPEGLLLSKKETNIHGLPAGEVKVSSRENTPCIFTMAHDVRLLPVELVGADWLVRRIHEANVPAEWKARSALRLRFRKTTPEPWAQIALDPLVVHVPRGDGLGYEILEHLFASQAGMLVRNPQDAHNPVVFKQHGQRVQKFGFDANSALLPTSARIFEGHRQLREYFALPERFMFFELAGFQKALAQCRGNELELVVAMTETGNRLEQEVKASSFKLYCVPAINLFSRQFSQVIEPDRYSEFHLVPDANRPLDFEIYSLETVEGFSDSAQFGLAFKSFFESHHLHRTGSAFYTLNRRPRSRAEKTSPTGEKIGTAYGGSEVFIALVDSEQSPFDGEINQLSVTARLSNRHLPVQLSQNPARWSISGGISARIAPLAGPTTPTYQPVDGPHAWRLLNLLAMNYMSLSEEHGDSGSVLRELLALLAGNSADWANQQIDALRGTRSRTISRPLYEPGRAGDPPRISAIVRGLEISLVFDDVAFLDLGVLLLGSVLEEFFARYIPINSFAETVIVTPDGRERMRWPTRSGLKPLV